MKLFYPPMLKDEHVVYVTGYHWIYVFNALMPLFAVIAAASIAWITLKSQIVSTIFLLLAFLAIFWVGKKWLDTQVIRAFVTNQRLIYRQGWTIRNMVDVTLDRVGGVYIDQDLWQRFFGYGTVKVIVPVIEIKLPRHLRNPYEFRCALYMQKAPPPPRPPDDEEKEDDEEDNGNVANQNGTAGGEEDET